MPKRRHLSRIAVMQVLFECEARGREKDDEMLTRSIAELGGEEAVDVSFAQTLLLGSRDQFQQTIDSLKQYAPQWPLERMDPVSRAILMMSVYELLFANDAPPPVVMNEAIDIAKEYGNAESGKFVNGVLNAIAHGRKTD
jgi:N utilization substance protein B